MKTYRSKAHPEEQVYGSVSGRAIIEDTPGLLERSLEQGITGCKRLMKTASNDKDRKSISSHLMEYSAKLYSLRNPSDTNDNN